MTEPGLADRISYMLRHLNLTNCRGGTSPDAEALTLDLKSARRQSTGPAAVSPEQLAALACQFGGVLVIAGIPFPFQK